MELRKSTADEVTRIVTTNGAGRTGIRDWDKEKLDRQKEREIRRGERERSATKEPVQPTKSLEELFNKTKVRGISFFSVSFVEEYLSLFFTGAAINEGFFFINKRCD